MSGLAVVSGRVVDPAGRGVRAWLTLAPVVCPTVVGGSVVAGSVSVQCDEAGRVSASVLPGRYALTLALTGVLHASVSVDLSVGGHDLSALLGLSGDLPPDFVPQPVPDPAPVPVIVVSSDGLTLTVSAASGGGDILDLADELGLDLIGDTP